MSSDSESINEIVIEEKFAIAIDDLVQVLKSNRPGTKRKSRHLTGHFINIFQKNLLAFEKNAKINSTNAVFYPGKRRANSTFLRINANCSLCSKSTSKKHFIFTIDENPFKVKKKVFNIMFVLFKLFYFKIRK